MKDFVRNHKKVAALFALGIILLLWGLWSSSAPIRGKLAARFDIRRGHYELLAIGLPPAWRPEYAQLLRQRYGIKLRVVAGCIVSQSLVSYVDKYNAVVANAARRRFGHDVFKECREEAMKTWKSGSGEKRD